MPEEITPQSIEEYLTTVINLDAQNVTEVAPVAAQAASDFANLGMPAQTDFNLWLQIVPAFRDRTIKYALSVRLATYLSRYENTTKTPIEVLQEIIAENQV